MKTRLHMNQKKPCPSLPVYGGDGENDISVICKNCWQAKYTISIEFKAHTRNLRVPIGFHHIDVIQLVELCNASLEIKR